MTPLERMQHGESIAAKLGANGWLQYWASFHEAAHAVVARHFGWLVEFATLKKVRIPHPDYQRYDEPLSIERLVISAAGDAATTCYFGYTNTGTLDNERQRDRLRRHGATEVQIEALMREAREKAKVLVIELRDEIEEVAVELGAYGRLTQAKIDAAIMAARSE